MDNQSNFYGPIFKVIADAVIAYYILLALVIVIVTAIIAIAVSYAKSKRQNEDADIDSKKYVSKRISMIVLAAALILILSPLIIGPFL